MSKEKLKQLNNALDKVTKWRFCFIDECVGKKHTENEQHQKINQMIKEADQYKIEIETHDLKGKNEYRV